MTNFDNEAARLTCLGHCHNSPFFCGTCDNQARAIAKALKEAYAEGERDALENPRA